MMIEKFFRKRAELARLSRLIAVLLAVLLVSPFYARTARAAYTNPPPEEIARKIEKVAREKKIPAVILKAIAYAESGWRQFDSSGNVVTGHWGSRPNLGIMQVGSYNPSDTETVNRLKYDIDFNIAYGADILNAKWEMVPKIGDGDRSKLENWYFAIWAYNSWSTRNNPNDAAAAGRVAYQDKILKYCATEYYKGLVTPVKITPVPAHLIPAGTLPSKNTRWETPQPVHYADFAEPAKPEAVELPEYFSRIGGRDRIDTANQIALTGWPHGCETVVIARSDDFPDALAGVALARKNNAPVLLTPTHELDSRVIEVLQKLKPLKAILLGGEGALGPEVEAKLREVLYWTDNIERIAGKDRYETAALIAAEFPPENGMVVATGLNFPDALSLASAAAAEGYPLLLVGKDHLPGAARNLLKSMSPRTLYIAGGEGAISPALEQEIIRVSGLSPGNVKRLGGKDRYDTSALIVKNFYPEASRLYLATGEDFPDALAGAALAAHSSSPMLLVSPRGVKTNANAVSYILSLSGELEIGVFGGKFVVPDSSLLEIKDLLEQGKI